LALAVFGGGLHLALQWLGMHYTTATSGILYLSTAPVLICLLAAPLLGERIGGLQWIGILVSLCGVCTIATAGDLRALATLSFNVGDLLSIGSMVLWAAYTIFLRKRRDSLDTPQFITVLCALGLVTVLPWVAAELALGAQILLTPAGVAAVVYSAVGALLLAYAGWSYVVQRLGAARAGATLHLMPALGVVLSAVFLGEYPKWFHFVGIALILSGVALSAVRPGATRRVA
jgi:drug/metabolite transporter (DMT)-like permease